MNKLEIAKYYYLKGAYDADTTSNTEHITKDFETQFELIDKSNLYIVVRQSEQFICDIEKGTRCKDSFPSYKDGKCHNCGGQAN